jgi:CO dehydrogenase/acetyl-CoA synthase alpha subunit
MRRIWDSCQTCRRCFNLCDAFPRVFDLIDTNRAHMAVLPDRVRVALSEDFD